MRVYQKYVFLPGTLLGVLLAIGVGGMVAAWRRLGGEILLPWAIAVAMIVVPAATAEFDYRYLLPAVPFACLAAAMVFGPGHPVGDRMAGAAGSPRCAAGTPPSADAEPRAPRPGRHPASHGAAPGREAAGRHPAGRRRSRAACSRAACSRACYPHRCRRVP